MFSEQDTELELSCYRPATNCTGLTRWDSAL